MEWSLFEILSGIEEMLSIILTKVWPKFGHAYWKGQDGQRKSITRAFHLTVSFSSIFRSADLKGPQSLKGATGLLPSATQHCWGNLLKNSCLRSSVLRLSPSSSLLDFQRALGINVTSGIVMFVVARSYVMESYAIFCEPKLSIYRVSCHVSAGKSKPCWYFNLTTPRMGEIRSWKVSLKIFGTKHNNIMMNIDEPKPNPMIFVETFVLLEGGLIVLWRIPNFTNATHEPCR